MTGQANPGDWIGRSETASDTVTSVALDRFAKTLELDADDALCVAQPGFHWCLATKTAPASEIGHDGHPSKGGFLPPIDLPRRMWASSRVSFQAPIKVGAAIERVSTIASVTEKQGSTGRLAFVEVDHTFSADGVAAIVERQTIVYRQPPGAAQPAAPPAARQDWAWQRELIPDPVLLFRYSALTFNGHRIHYDAPYVTEVEGYPGLIVHGPLTATLLMDFCRRNLGGRKLASFTFRGQSPAFADRPLRLCGNIDGDAIALGAFGEDGRLVMSASAAVG